MRSTKSCRVSGGLLNEIIDFGRQPLGNGFLDKVDFKNEYFYEMKLGFNDTSKMVQLLFQPDPEKMFHEDYAFFSSTSLSMSKHFEQLYAFINNSSYISNLDPFIVELGCNDGILLKHFALKGINHLGIEPSINVAEMANKNGVQTISKFFNKNLAKDIVQNKGRANIVVSANVMCHIPNIVDVVEGLSILIADKGVLIFEDPYLGDVVEKTSYDQIYDEHVYLFSAISVKKLFEKYGFELIDLQPQKTHGGSMRYILAHKGMYDIQPNVNKILDKEKILGLDNLDKLNIFASNVKESRIKLIKLLKTIKSRGKTIAGYAATSKSTTILNYCKIGTEYIDYISDTTPIKQGRFSPGMHIPIVSHQHFLDNPPDFAFLLAWNHLDEIISKESKFTENGGKWIINVPEPRIL
tara:strand:- start:8 stop:1237 length:1230 start_codon:yes stop_codon:yes gene_type:complete